MKLRHRYLIKTILAKAITQIDDEYYHTALDDIRQAEKLLVSDIREYNANDVEYRKSKIRIYFTELQQELYNLGETE